MQDENMAAFLLPTNLVEAAEGDGTPERRLWMDELPSIVRELAQRWSVELGPPYQPGGECSWVAPVRDSAGRDLVLKVGWRRDAAADEAAGLRVWDGRGAVRCYDAHVSGSTSALLLERCLPGTALGSGLPEPEQDLVIASLLRRLWSAPHDARAFRPLQEMCDAWAAEFEERYASAPAGLDPGLARDGMALFRSLPSSAEQEVLLCTDLHPGNVLATRREPWLVIDPKPYVGDPAYDVLQHLLNCDERLVADPLGLAWRMADLLELDRARVTQWLFARCVQESISEPWLSHIVPTLARM